MSNFKMALSLAAICLSGSAMAQELEGARLGFDYKEYDDGQGFEATFGTLIGDVSMLFDNGFGGQLTLGTLQFFHSNQSLQRPDGGSAVALHGFFDVSPATRLGAYLGYNGLGEVDALHFGVELVHQLDRLRLEARLGHADSDQGFDNFDLAEVYAQYDLNDRLQLRGGLRYEDSGDYGHYGLATIGIAYDLGNRARLYADYGWQDQEFGSSYPDIYGGNLVTVGVEITLGDSPAPKMFRFNPQF
ncbi:hypothetical protein SAMN06297129_0028 [Pseudooceanicola antarcticus]|uniref:Porin n=1 Tax=Pseudooceanicola antarcticus TaxID=1247613 RepID=A0A285HLD4_9RHOB|nr:hypothetical protein [Pseudooceanicola antarcticus]PJE27986.1 hypothetical protein CVM39_15635 [Pseudooceanicola antarcticus]SNY35501.1 hypothetical protein SAMN06297129_0028 [Pseudooceanicola antarcticus]